MTKRMSKYDKQVESNVTMVRRNDRGDFVKVCRISDGKRDSLDIRGMYTSDNDNQIYPTQKGVRLHDEMLVETVAAILDCLNEAEMQELNEEYGYYIDDSDQMDTDTPEDEE